MKKIVKKRDMSSYPDSKFVLSSHSEPSAVMPSISGDGDSPDHLTTVIKFVFSEKATKIDEIFTVDLTVCSRCQIDGEDFVKFGGLLRKHEL